MKIKVDDLSGRQLDFWVYCAEETVVFSGTVDNIKPVDWNFVGPKIERSDLWEAVKTGLEVRLEFFKRCIVKRKYGEEVDAECQ